MALVSVGIAGICNITRVHAPVVHLQNLPQIAIEAPAEVGRGETNVAQRRDFGGPVGFELRHRAVNNVRCTSPGVSMAVQKEWIEHSC